SRGAEKQIEGIKRARDAREVRGVEHAQEIRTQLEELTVKVAARVAESGSLFGAVTANDVAQAVKKAGGPAIDKRSVSFAKPVKTAGRHTVSIKLHPAVTARVAFEVVAA
ncbi:MAG: 50S ribosomal protein L9, partial [Propionibacteriaceae bacterium]|nr:50S ribosomal protein L9 [Propionibacteriaceae bacterium]